MSNVKTYSQSKQDLFALKVAEILNRKENLDFVDIGCNIPDWQSNSKLLLESGWKGIGIDLEAHPQAWAPYRNFKFIHGDATTYNWYNCGPETSYYLDFLSCDVDNATFLALQNFINYGFKFHCACVEHDAYRFGDTLRVQERNLLRNHGYVMVAKNVCGGNMDFPDGCPHFPYEDWWIMGSIPENKKEEIISWVNQNTVRV
jgi:hypothetical protein